MWKKWLLIGLVIVGILLLIPYSLPLIFAFLTAVLLEGIVKWCMENLKFSRVQAVVAVCTGYVFFLMVVGYYFVSTLIEQTISLSQKTPTFAKDFYHSVVLPLIRKWEFYSKNLPVEVIQSLKNTLEKNINNIDVFLQSFLQDMFSLAAAVPGFLIEFIIYLVALFLLSFDLPRLKSKVEAHMKDETREKVYLVTNQLNRAGVGFIKAQIILSFVTFVLAFTGLLILKAPYAALLSVLIVIVDILPILGTGSVLVPWAVVAIFQGNTFLGIGLIILFLVITVIRRIIEPKVYSSSLGISPLASLVSLYIGFKILGIAGIFIGPVLVIIYDTLKRGNIIKIDFKI